MVVSENSFGSCDLQSSCNFRRCKTIGNRNHVTAGHHNPQIDRNGPVCHRHQDTDCVTDFIASVDQAVGHSIGAFAKLCISLFSNRATGLLSNNRDRVFVSSKTTLGDVEPRSRSTKPFVKHRGNHQVFFLAVGESKSQVAQSLVSKTRPDSRPSNDGTGNRFRNQPTSSNSQHSIRLNQDRTDSKSVVECRIQQS